MMLANFVSLQLGNTALHIACRDGLVEIVQLLCAHKADTALQNNQVCACVWTMIMHKITHSTVGAIIMIMTSL